MLVIVGKDYETTLERIEQAFWTGKKSRPSDIRVLSIDG